ncbi:MAG: type IV pili methyl-accepting chemotaxis transducer N-terminal domain-containing protein, partial [Rhizobacter sp.]|nr:type IV pili methyl-accepting chemotaxis transducer N-terminal domain-containing protein [Rhizobacter sp.]
MSFLDKIKTIGKGRDSNALDSDDPGIPLDDVIALDRPMRDASAGSPAQGDPLARTVHMDSSIITEAAPSEIADFAETRLPASGSDDAPGATGLPLIGNAPVATQQRILLSLVGLGLAGLIGMTIYSLNSASKGSAQVAASGQALMQSQRLAKSVSQALIGSAAAFPEVKESTEVLAKSVRGLAKGEGGLDAAPSSVQESLAPMVPLVDRAEKNANTVMGQEKILTQVGKALRTINRQSSDLLEIAETVSSLKLQQEASPAELSAVGQLVMLTQRIGKSANEFLTMEGVSPEAVFLLGKDLNSFREIADGLLNGNAELRLPGTKDAQTKERLQALLKQYEETRTEAGSILGNLQGLVSAREAQASIIADSEPLRKGLETVQDRLGAVTGFSTSVGVTLFLFALLLAAGGAGLLKLYVNDQA